MILNDFEDMVLSQRKSSNQEKSQFCFEWQCLAVLPALFKAIGMVRRIIFPGHRSFLSEYLKNVHVSSRIWKTMLIRAEIFPIRVADFVYDEKAYRSGLSSFKLGDDIWLRFLSMLGLGSLTGFMRFLWKNFRMNGLSRSADNGLHIVKRLKTLCLYY